MTTSELLHQRLTEVSAALRHAKGPAQLAQVLRQEDCSILVLEDHPWLRAAAALLGTGSDREISFISETGPLTIESLDTVVTVGLGAVPETGSVLLSSRFPRAFRLSLCPRRHIVVIPADQASLTIAEALSLTAREPSGLVSWVSGPSRTADIEKVLVLGAQGASELLVIIYQDD